jgi:hypothetical protein
MPTIPFTNPAPPEPVPLWFYLLNLLAFFFSGVWVLVTNVAYAIFVCAVWLSEAIRHYFISAAAHFSGAREFERENVRPHHELEKLIGQHKDLRKHYRELLVSELSARKEAQQMSTRFLDEKSLVARLLEELSAANKAKFDISRELRNLRLKHRSLAEQVCSDDKAEAMIEELQGNVEKLEKKLKDQSDASFDRHLALVRENEALEAKIKDIHRTHPVLLKAPKAPSPPVPKAKAPPKPAIAPMPAPPPPKVEPKEQPQAPPASNGITEPKLPEIQTVRPVKALRRRTPASILAANAAVPLLPPPSNVDEHPAEAIGYFSD